MLLLNTFLVAVCSHTNSGLVTSPLGHLLARMLKGVWARLLLDESVQLSLQTHQRRASRHAKPFMKLRAARGSTTRLDAC